MEGVEQPEPDLTRPERRAERRRLKDVRRERRRRSRTAAKDRKKRSLSKDHRKGKKGK